MKTTAFKTGLVIIQVDNGIVGPAFFLARKRVLKSGVRKYTIQGEVKIKGIAYFKESTFEDYIHSYNDKELGLNYKAQVRLAFQDQGYEINEGVKGTVLKTGGYYNGVLTRSSAYGMDEIVYTEYDEIAYGVSEVEWNEQVTVCYDYPGHREIFEEVVKGSTDLNCVSDLRKLKDELGERFHEIEDARVKEALTLEPEWKVNYSEGGYELTDEEGELILKLENTTALFNDLRMIREFYEQWKEVSFETRKEVLNEWVDQKTKQFSQPKHLYGLRIN